MSNPHKVLLVGWDAADWKIIHQLMDAGKMPATRALVENGVMGNLRTLWPVLSPMLWTSIATGKRPFKHGIYGFTEPAVGAKGVQPMTIASRKCKAIWNILSQNNLQSIVVGWWPSHPAEPIHGAMVSDYYHKAPRKPGDDWPLMRGCIHPSRLFNELAELRVHPLELDAEDLLPFVPHGSEIDQETDSRLSALMRTTAECTTVHAAATHLLANEPWDFAAIYYDAIDHYSHAFMRYHPPQQSSVSDEDFHLYQHVVSSAYVYHDMMLRRLLELVSDDTTVILMSDHGFHSDHLRPLGIPVEPAGPAAEHRDFGIFVAKGPGIKKDHLIHGANLLDVAPTILSIFGLPIGLDMDGQPLVDIFETRPEIGEIPSWEEVEGDDGRHPKNMVIDPAESKAALEQLIALGYIARPDKDSDKAIRECTRELDYNLARAYMDAEMYGEAIPLLVKLYNEHVLEFRFGIQLANCLTAMQRTSDLERLLADLNSRWRVAAREARQRIQQIAVIAKERRKQWSEMKEIDEKNKHDPSRPPKLARVTPDGRPVLFSDQEQQAIRKLRAIARGNPQTLDFLAATIATSKGDFETALHCLKQAELTTSKNPSFQVHVGNVYLGLKRYQEATRAFDKALELDEYHANALLGKCRVCLETKQLAQAIDYGKQGVGLKFHFAVAHFFLAEAKGRSGDFEGAIQSLKTAIEQNPSFREAHERLAQIYSLSHLDEELARYHTAAARRLAAETAELVESTEPIELPEIDLADLLRQMPNLPGEGENTEEFIRCLAQSRESGRPSNGSASDETPPEIIVVSGLPRSGTSMMMQMLVAGGLEPFTDQHRPADESNTKGYYESEIVKQLFQKNTWLRDCAGKVVKIVAPLIPYLPQIYHYKVIFMQREIDEIVASQNKMLARMELAGGNIGDDRMAMVFSRQAQYAGALLALHRYPVLSVAYQNVIADPLQAATRIEKFLGKKLHVAKMAAVVDPSMYRERATTAQN